PTERLVVLTPGGAGIGAPGARARGAVARDVADELVSTEEARGVYGVGGASSPWWARGSAVVATGLSGLPSPAAAPFLGAPATGRQKGPGQPDNATIRYHLLRLRPRTHGFRSCWVPAASRIINFSPINSTELVA